MSGPKKTDDLKGLDALGEIGRRLGGLADQVRDALEAAENAGEDGIDRQTTFESKDGRISGVAGMRVRTGIGTRGAAGASPSASTSAKPAQRAEDAAPPGRKIDIEVHDLGETLVLSAELPGVDERALDIRVDDRLLTLKAHGVRHYDTEVALPAAVASPPRRVKLTNGILEIVLAKMEAGTND